MRITREKVEELVMSGWDRGFAAGKLAGAQQLTLEEQQKALARTEAIDFTESALDTAEAPKGKKSGPTG